MAIQNALNLTSTGIVTHDGAGAFVGSAVTQGGVLLAGAANAVVDTGVLAKGTLLVGDGVLDPTLLPVGTDGQQLQADSAQASGVKWAASSNTFHGTPAPSDVNTITYFSDFMESSSSVSGGWTVQGSKATANASNLNAGVVKMSGNITLDISSGGDFLGNGETTMIARFTRDGSLTIGAGRFSFGYNSYGTNDRVQFLIDGSIDATPNWIISTSNGGVSTDTITGVTLTNGGVWQVLKIVINAAGTSAEFFIDGVSLGTQSTNFPSTTTRMSIGAFEGLDANGMDVDYMLFNKVMSNDRS